MLKPVWNELYSVAANTYNHFVWFDLSLIYNCPAGIVLRSYLCGQQVYLIDDEIKQDNSECGVYIIIDGMFEQWLEWQSKATEYQEKYNKWQKVSNKTLKQMEEI